MRKEYDFSKGRRGAVVSSKGKTRITIMLDDDILGALSCACRGGGHGLSNDDQRCPARSGRRDEGKGGWREAVDCGGVA